MLFVAMTAEFCHPVCVADLCHLRAGNSNHAETRFTSSSPICRVCGFARSVYACTGPNHHNHHNHHGRRDNDYNHNKYYNEYHNKYYDYHHGCTG